MKRLITTLIISLLLVGIPLEVCSNDVVISGTVKNRANKKKLPSVSLTIPGTNIGTVSNADGTFTLKIPDSLSINGINAELLGFKSYFIPGDMIVNNNNGNVFSILLTPSAKVLDEVTVYGADPRALVETALEKIPQNYPAEKNLFSAFYRETIQKGKRYISVSEAIVKVLKSPYKTRKIAGDKVQIEKGRRLVSQRISDTLSVKVIGGPAIPVVLDMVKNEDLLFRGEELDFYDFKMEPMTSIDDRPQFVVSFTPRVKVDYPLYRGKVYIDRKTCAFSKAEFSLDLSDKEKVIRSILHKKPRGLRFNPQEVDFVVSYKYQDGLSYLNYISAKTRFKCDWTRRLFSAGYTVLSELVMVDRNDDPTVSISRKDAFGQKEVFYDMVDNFSDPDFWKDYNIIEPTESLEKAVLRLKN
ncbi:MAG: carboxypeptidase-like regulatory domain-containing protein [Muribaculaceae bacterium]|nr:carboxypeptidase-like regulatory domain-containing protein [Muribaculaceae bacterium]